MKLIVLLGFASLITGHPVKQNGMDEDRPTMEQHILDHLSEMVLSLNFSDIQPNLKTLPVSQLSSCITTEQRHLVNVCVSKAHCSLSTSQDFQDMETTDEANTSHEDDSHEHSSNYSHSQLDNSPRALFPVVMKCLVDTISPVEEGDGGEINMANLRLSIVEKTLLTPAQKEIASESFVTCMSSNFTMPQDETERNETSPLVAQGDNVRTLAAIKAMLCVARSIILNGCADMTVRKPAALEMVDDLDVGVHPTDTSQETRTGASDDKVRLLQNTVEPQMTDADMVGVLK